MGTSIIFPKTANPQRGIREFHDQCHYYDRGLERFAELRRMPLDVAVEAVRNETAKLIECNRWEYDQDVSQFQFVAVIFSLYVLRTVFFFGFLRMVLEK
ncbi:unnamed protein product [Gongylonema pulchrum]|uniref:Squalene synthase n=1 Tax=Gongylonema pulchrum TaxID=637853 RepID=A0A183DJP1_9BILA|nr:unnamed protein product [Gongylonema pulchrum]